MILRSRAPRVIQSVAIGVMLCACAAPLRLTQPYCAPPQIDVRSQLQVGAELPASNSREAQLAALLGISDALDERKAAPLSSATRLHVLERITRARLAIAAIEAELDCEGERTKQAATYLANNQASTVQRVTVASIVTAAAVSVASVLLSTKNASPVVQDVVGIGGASVAAGLGFATLYVSPTLHFEHSRNLLRDIWIGPATSSIYPPIVWAYLSRPTFSNAQDVAIRAKLVQRFKHLGATDNAATTRELLFGRGGQFDAETLRAQAALLDQVKAEVALENQDLQVLVDHLFDDGAGN